MKRLQEALGFLWPGFRLLIATSETDEDRIRLIMGKRSNTSWTIVSGEAVKEVEDLVKNINAETFEDSASQIHESEGERRATLESKAAEIIKACGIFSLIIAAIPTISSYPWRVSFAIQLLLGCLFLLTIAHLLTAIFLAAQARRVTPVFLPSYDEFKDLLVTKPEDVKKQNQINDLARAVLNEPLLRMKSNYISSAESHYYWGLILFAAIAMISIGAHIFVPASPMPGSLQNPFKVIVI